MNLSNYINLAQKNLSINSANKLARELDISQTAVSNFLTGKAYPADNTMLKLAALAGIPPEVALIDVSIWRNKNNPEALRFWENIREKIDPKN